MSGRHSMKKRTISGLEIIDIDTKENLLVKGSIPGKSGNLVSIRTKS
jgi:ribosomal protein L3